MVHHDVELEKKNALYRYVYYCSVNFDSIDVSDILDIHKYLMDKNKIK